MQIKFNYSEGGEFILPSNFFKTNEKDLQGNTIVSNIYGKKYSVDSTNHYIGYVNVDENGKVYTEKYYDENSVELSFDVEYGADYIASKYFKDRLLYKQLKLPYGLNELLIEPNEIVNFNLLNQKIKYLHENLIFMYSKLFVGSTEVPVDRNVNILCSKVDTTNFQWEKRTESSFSYNKIESISEYSLYKEYDMIKSFVVIPIKNNPNVISIIAISNTHVIGLSSQIDNNGQLSNHKILLYTDVIDNYSQQQCINLEDVCFDGRYLYISDSKVNGGGQVFKYDVTTFYTNDNVFEGKKFLVEPIGGTGTTERKNKFNGCSILGITSNELWVYDSGNNVIKIFDKGFIFKKLLKVPTGQYKILDIRYRKMNDKIYLLYKNYSDVNNLKFGYFEYTSNYKLTDTIQFSDVLYEDNDKEFNRMCISEQDSNVFYVISNNSIYKKFFSNPESSFAIFDRGLIIPDDNFIWNVVDNNWDEEFTQWTNDDFFSMFKVNDIFILGSDKNKDDLFCIGNSFISHFNEKTNYQSVLKDINPNYYNYNKIKFESIEYNQTLTLNKELYKLFSNLIQIKNNLKGRFFAEYNKYGDLIYIDYVCFDDIEINLLDLETIFNSFINDNEFVQPNVLNRFFKKIYEFQINLFNLTTAKVKNIKTKLNLREDINQQSNIYAID
jgi:hypothetical protein